MSGGRFDHEELTYHGKCLCGKQDFDKPSCKENFDDLFDKR